jgi:hypothetical protein
MGALRWPTVRRLIRILFNVATALSLLLCVASAGLWARARWRDDIVEYEQRSGAWSVTVVGSGGGLIVYRLAKGSEPQTIQLFTSPGLRFESKQPDPDYWTLPWTRAEGFAGFRYESGTFFRHPVWLVRIPLWFLRLLTVPLPARAAWRWFRPRRWARDPNSCAACGYDLRATPDKCPECGQVPAGR